VSFDEELSARREHSWVTVQWHGDVDMANAKPLRHQTLEAVTNSDLGLIIDLTDVEYIDSAGIRTLIEIRRLLEERQQRLLMVLPDDALIRKGLHIGGVTAVIPTYPSHEAALAAR